MSSDQQQNNSLVEISSDLLEKLRDLYKANWPEHVVAFNFIDFMIKKFKKHPKSREVVKFYSTNGAVNEDATFISIMRDKEIILDTLDPTFKCLEETLKLVDYSKNRHFMNTKNAYRETLLNFIADWNFESKLWDDTTVMMHLPKEDALNLQYEIPTGFSVRSLSISNAEKINSLWAHASPGSAKFIEYIIEFNPSVGVYDENNELVAWCLFHDFTLFLTLQTDPNHLRKGYAEIATKALAKKVAEEYQLDSVASIIQNNFKSINLFTKIGFKQIDSNSWIGLGKVKAMN